LGFKLQVAGKQIGMVENIVTGYELWVAGKETGPSEPGLRNKVQGERLKGKG